jgi:hypothetical protein
MPNAVRADLDGPIFEVIADVLTVTVSIRRGQLSWRML